MITTRYGLDLSRQSMIIPSRAANKTRLLVIGAGGIGSNAAYVAACMGVGSITVYDHDRVDTENIAPQFYRRMQAGEFKVEALRDNILEFTGVEIDARRSKYIDEQGEYDIVLVGVDSMKARNTIWNKNRLSWRWWLDGRMGGTSASVIAIQNMVPYRMDRYIEEYLKWESSTLPCGLKSTAYITKGIMAGMIGEAIATIIAGDNEGKIPLWQTRDSTVLDGVQVF